MQWQEENSDENEQLFNEVLGSEKEVWKKTIAYTHENLGIEKNVFLPGRNVAAAKGQRKIKLPA
jgi:hypothetical protein